MFVELSLLLYAGSRRPLTEKTAFRPKKALKNYLLLLADTLEEGKLISRLRDKSFAAANELNSPLV